MSELHYIVFEDKDSNSGKHTGLSCVVAVESDTRSHRVRDCAYPILLPPRESVTRTHAVTITDETEMGLFKIIQLVVSIRRFYCILNCELLALNR